MDDKLTRWNLAKLQHQLKCRINSSAGMSVIGASPMTESPAPVEVPPMPDMAAPQANMERMINAAAARGAKYATDAARIA